MATITPIAQGTTKKLTDDLNNNFNNLNTELAGLKQAIIDTVYPINSIFITMGTANPSTFLGGTWEAIGAGRCLIGSGYYSEKGHEYRIDLGDTGGEKLHTLTVDELPKNIGTFRTLSWNSDNTATGAFSITEQLADRADAGTGNLYGTAQYSLSGGGQPHNNMPPYLVVNMWKRTA